MSQRETGRRNRGGQGEPRLFIATWIVQGNQRSRATVGVDVGVSAWAWLGPGRMLRGRSGEAAGCGLPEPPLRGVRPYLSFADMRAPSAPDQGPVTKRGGWICGSSRLPWHVTDRQALLFPEPASPNFFCTPRDSGGWEGTDWRSSVINHGAPPVGRLPAPARMVVFRLETLARQKPCRARHTQADRGRCWGPGTLRDIV